MKKLTIRILCCFFLITLTLSACNTSLKEDPRSIISPDQYFKSDQEAITSVNGVYAYLYSTYGEDYFNPAISGTDICILKSPTSLPNAHFLYTLSSANPGRYMPGYWRNLYRAIGAANMVINRVGKSDVNSDVKNRVIGEAKFLRALYYLKLTEVWGDVPLWTEELNVDKVSNLPRASIDEVHAQMVKDLTDAASKLPQSYSSDDKGRVTAGAAEAFLSRVYLYMSDWQDARNAALKVMNSGTYRLLPDYAEVFALNNENNDEIIFSVQYKQDERPGYLHSWFEPSSNEGIKEFNGYGIFLPTKWFIESFEEGDKRKDNIIITEWNGQPLSRSFFGIKFLDISAPPRNSGKNFIVLRYADVLLMLAESENEVNGPTTLAYEAINKVRKRAGLGPLSGLSQEQLRQAIRLERAHELAGEGLRRWDINRWETLVKAVKKVKEDNPTGAKNVQPYHELFPIPPAELIKNPNLTQNPGY